jgi:protocatechuate 3,4-dioxygenase beta subunit
MYFPGDPLQPIDPIFNSIPEEPARQRLVSRLDMERSQSNYALDIVSRGSKETPFEDSQRP